MNKKYTAQEMREAQRNYFNTRDRSWLDKLNAL